MFGKRIDCDLVATKPLVLKPYGKDRLLPMTEWFNDQEVTRYLSGALGFTVEAEEKWHENMSESPTDYQWGIFWDDRHVGSTGLMHIDPINRNADYGITIGEKDAWGKGIGTAVAKAVAGYGFNALNLEYVYADVFLLNMGSKKALEKAGFTEYGRKPGSRFIDGAYCVEWKCALSRADWLKRSNA